MNKKSIGIYGDSFANFNNTSLDLGPSWTELLNTKYQVTNYALPGKSPYACYSDYIKNRSSHDYNIFVSPSLTRTHSARLSNLFKDTAKINYSDPSWYIGLSSVSAMDDLLQKLIAENPNNSKLIKKLEIVQSVKYFYETWADFKYIIATNKALVNTIKSEENTLFIEADPEIQGLHDLCIWELMQLGYQNKYLDNGQQLGSVNFNTGQILGDTRKNHLSDENNVVLFKKVSACIDNNKTGELIIDCKEFLSPAGPIEKYLKWRNYK